jgi:hypothetical protein
MNEETVTLKKDHAGRVMVSEILPVMIASMESNHELWHKKFESYYDPKKYVRDFRTLRLNMGQRMGHTYAVIQLAKPGDLIVELSDHRALDICSQTLPGVECIGVKTLMEAGKKFYTAYNTIWLLNYDLWPRTSMNEIRERLIKNSNQRMIILQ